MKAILVAIGALAGVIAFEGSSWACGAAYPGGPVMCDFSDAPGYKEKNAKPTLRLSASYAFTSTTILFGGSKRADLTRHAVFGGLEIPLSNRITGQISAGGIAGGSLDHGDARDSMGPGFSGSIGMAARVVDGRGAAPVVQLTLGLSGTHAITHAGNETPRFTAFDLRGGVVASKTLGEIFTPYVVGRIFGGPVYWHYDGEAVTGTDLHKYQVGGGFALSLFKRRLDVFVEGIALGEKGVATGVGTTFF